MLANNFKSPAALGISDAEFQALFTVLGMLERGELHHVSLFDGRLEGDNLFNMTTVGACGTPACMLGWAQIVSNNRDLFGSCWGKDANPKLCELFAFHGYAPAIHRRDDIPTDQAAIALRNYLTHGEARWAEALAAQ